MSNPAPELRRLPPLSQSFSSALRHTGRPILRRSVRFPDDAALVKAEESPGLMCQHPGLLRGAETLIFRPKSTNLGQRLTPVGSGRAEGDTFPRRLLTFPTMTKWQQRLQLINNIHGAC